jgi:hypothetical protein
VAELIACWPLGRWVWRIVNSVLDPGALFSGPGTKLIRSALASAEHRLGAHPGRIDRRHERVVASLSISSV